MFKRRKSIQGRSTSARAGRMEKKTLLLAIFLLSHNVFLNNLADLLGA